MALWIEGNNLLAEFTLFNHNIVVYFLHKYII
jgi:hypothetical protein